MKVLIAVDGSPYTAKAVDYLITHKEAFGSLPELACIHVSTPLPLRAARAVGKDITDGYYAEEAQRATDAALKAFEQAGLGAQLLTKRGDAGEEIARAADKGGFDMIVMGSHGHTALGSLVMGSVATRVLASCKIPVLLVR